MMKKIIIFLLVFICIFLISCNKEYTIEFETNGGNKIQKLKSRILIVLKIWKHQQKKDMFFVGGI